MSSYRMRYKIGLVEHSIAVPEEIPSAIPVGTILPYLGSVLPYGFLWCDHSALSREMYPDLFAVIGTTYGSGDGSTTFNLPNLINGSFLEGSDSAGISKNAGLPNIKGVASARFNSGGYYVGFGNVSGAFYNSGTQAHNASVGSGNIGDGFLGYLQFDASRSSAVYGNSSTVQPKSLTVRFIIKAFSQATPYSSEIDFTYYASDLATRLQRQQIPAYNQKVRITISGTFTALVTGWHKFTLRGGGAGGNSGRLDDSSSYRAGGGGGGQGGLSFATVYMEKNSTATITIGAGGTGGAKPTEPNISNNGTSGGKTTVTVNGTTYTAGGGYTGDMHTGGDGGNGDIYGAVGQPGNLGYPVSARSFSGGKGGGGYAGNIGQDYGTGGDGGHGYASTTYTYAGGAGKQGAVWVEYFDPTL